MRLIDKLENKFGRIAIKHLMLYVCICYAVGYVLFITNNYGVLDALSLNAEKILHGQVWRIVSYLVQPPTSARPLFFFITLYFYYMIGRYLEYQWGAFKFNVYFFSGMLLNVIAAIVIFLIFGINMPMSVYFLNLSLFMAFALEQPDRYMLLFFIIPFKAKWFALIDAIYFGTAVLFGFLSLGVRLPDGLITFLSRIGINPSPTAATAAVIAMMNFIIFYFVFKVGGKSSSRQQNQKQYQYNPYGNANRSGNNNQNNQRGAYTSQAGPTRIPRHRCAICGKTEFNAPNEDFRFCTSCEGAFEYCSEHLHNHKHVYRDKDGNLKRD